MGKHDTVGLLYFYLLYSTRLSYYLRDVSTINLKIIKSSALYWNYQTVGKINGFQQILLIIQKLRIYIYK